MVLEVVLPAAAGEVDGVLLGLVLDDLVVELALLEVGLGGGVAGLELVPQPVVLGLDLVQAKRGKESNEIKLFFMFFIFLLLDAVRAEGDAGLNHAAKGLAHAAGLVDLPFTLKSKNI